MKGFDGCTAQRGKGNAVFCQAVYPAAWKMKREMLSPYYITRIGVLVVIRAV
nr:DUF4113 domain-containing protein [Superficieibacter sp.]